MMDMMGNMTNRVMRPTTMVTATSPKGIYSRLLFGEWPAMINMGFTVVFCKTLVEFIVGVGF